MFSYQCSIFNECVERARSQTVGMNEIF